jgi:hypothetical protein
VQWAATNGARFAAAQATITVYVGCSEMVGSSEFVVPQRTINWQHGPKGIVFCRSQQGGIVVLYEPEKRSGFCVGAQDHDGITSWRDFVTQAEAVKFACGEVMRGW